MSFPSSPSPSEPNLPQNGSESDPAATTPTEPVPTAADRVVPPPLPFEPPPPSLASRLWHRVYSHNPFYLLSVCFVLHGTRFWLRDGASLNSAWQFMAVICGFILLLDLTAFVIVRWGKVWDDARTILLTLLFLFVTLALTFDQTLLAQPLMGQALLVGGFLFCSLVTEGLLLGLGIRLPALFRIPYYLQLGLLFLYPVGLQPDATTDAASLSWRIWVFSPLAAIALLSLVPAIRHGREYVKHNGTPWAWPLFPWCVFVFLALGLGYRAYALSLSFDPVMSLDSAAAWNLEAAFGGWFLVPLILAAGFLLLEIGRVERLPFIERLGLAVPAVAMLLAFPVIGRSVPHDEFLAMFRAALCAPALPALVLVTLFYAYAFLKGVRYGQECLSAAVLMFAVVGLDSVDVRTFTPIQPWPLATVALFQLAMGVRDGRSPRVLFALMCGAAAVRFGDWGLPTTMLRNAVWFGLIEAALIGVSWWYRDRFARALRPVSAWVMAGFAWGLLEWPEQFEPRVPAMAVAAAVVLMGVLAVAFSRRMPSLAWYFLGWFVSAAGTLRTGLIAYGSVRYYRGPLDIDSLLLGAAFFFLAILISTAKGGLLQKMVRWIPAPPDVAPLEPSRGT
jgi:hypothetical protein